MEIFMKVIKEEMGNLLIGFAEIGQYLQCSNYMVNKIRFKYPDCFREVDRYGNGSTPVTTKVAIGDFLIPLRNNMGAK